MPCGNFLPENRRLERGRYPPSELSFQEDFAKETEIMTDFYRGIWEQAL
jgi:hypothetical protein